ANEKGPLGIINIQINDEQQLIFSGIHLNANNENRSTQIPVLADSMKSYSDIPVILAGNFNATPLSGDSFQPFVSDFGAPCASCPPNFPDNDPSSFSDFIIYKP